MVGGGYCRLLMPLKLPSGADDPWGLIGDATPSRTGPKAPLGRGGHRRMARIDPVCRQICRGNPVGHRTGPPPNHQGQSPGARRASGRAANRGGVGTPAMHHGTTTRPLPGDACQQPLTVVRHRIGSVLPRVE